MGIALPAKLGVYRLEKEIGSGGFGTVYCAFDEGLSRYCAVKVPSNPSNPRTARRQVEEARKMSSLRHPSIVEVFFADPSHNPPYFAMELLDGNLGAELPVADAEAARIIYSKILEGVGRAHSEGIVHCDLKPTNILLGRGGSVKVSDFGLAKVVKEALNDEYIRISNETPSPGGLGTLGYTAPELFDGEPHSTRSDVYALGMIFKHLRDWSGDEAAEDFLQRSLHYDPSRRFCDAAEMLRAFERLEAAEGHPTDPYIRMPAPVAAPEPYAAAPSVAPPLSAARSTASADRKKEESSGTGKAAKFACKAALWAGLAFGAYALGSHFVQNVPMGTGKKEIPSSGNPSQRRMDAFQELFVKSGGSFGGEGKSYPFASLGGEEGGYRILLLEGRMRRHGTLYLANPEQKPAETGNTVKVAKGHPALAQLEKAKSDPNLMTLTVYFEDPAVLADGVVELGEEMAVIPLYPKER
jgi:hypothetical protein